MIQLLLMDFPAFFFIARDAEDEHLSRVGDSKDEKRK